MDSISTAPKRTNCTIYSVLYVQGRHVWSELREKTSGQTVEVESHYWQMGPSEPWLQSCCASSMQALGLGEHPAIWGLNLPSRQNPPMALLSNPSTVLRKCVPKQTMFSGHRKQNF
jgi:hypothetical protein